MYRIDSVFVNAKKRQRAFRVIFKRLLTFIASLTKLDDIELSVDFFFKMYLLYLIFNSFCQNIILV